MVNYQVKNSTSNPVKLLSNKEEFILMPGEVRDIPRIAGEKLTFAEGVGADITLRRRKIIKNGFSLAGKILKEKYNKVMEVALPEAFTMLKIKSVHHISDDPK